MAVQRVTRASHNRRRPGGRVRRIHKEWRVGATDHATHHAAGLPRQRAQLAAGARGPRATRRLVARARCTAVCHHGARAAHRVQRGVRRHGGEATWAACRHRCDGAARPRAEGAPSTAAATHTPRVGGQRATRGPARRPTAAAAASALRLAQRGVQLVQRLQRVAAQRTHHLRHALNVPHHQRLCVAGEHRGAQPHNQDHQQRLPHRQPRQPPRAGTVIEHGVRVAGGVSGRGLQQHAGCGLRRLRRRRRRRRVISNQVAHHVR